MDQLRAQLGILKYNSLPKGKIHATLRLGTLLATECTQINENASQIDLGIRFKLNIDNLNLSQMQRCSITLSFQDNRILGVVVIAIPKTTNEISTVCKLVQSADKKAELCLKLKMSQVEQQIEQNQNGIEQLKKVIQNGKISPIKRRQSVNNTRNKTKTESSLDKNWSTVFDKTQIKTTLKPKKVVSEEQINKLKQEKDIYSQLYKIEKSKNQVASKFISSLIAKLTNQYPELLNCFIEYDTNPLKRKLSGNSSPRKYEQSEIIKHLEQANRSLHRQLDQYKKVNEQLKNQLLKNSDKNIKLDPFGSINQFFPIRSSILQRSQKTNSPVKKLKNISPFQAIDVKKWLQESIGQRHQLHQWLKRVPKTNQSQSKVDRAKFKLKIDKAFLTLFSKNTFNRESIFIHKQEITKVIDQFLI